MGFRQNGKTKLAQRRAYAAWLAESKGLLERSGLAECVTRSRDDWAYFLFFGYHQVGNWNTPPDSQQDFRWEDLDEGQRHAVEELRVRWKVFSMSNPILEQRLG